ncbi:hypothetical protein EW026_g3918 [Hermanssonia centrifuga]|uniref:NADP-dependent oxidoreductase domain-containing protein n=1 Tax=Hermanssonia centrifuga TaxID=98765 RepID=A0A4S4KIR7_9APHY|nr:hypothetical protein EW026_g3918 [Hermanssonia centrifuga]
MAPQQKSALNIVMGCMTFGAEGKEGTSYLYESALIRAEGFLIGARVHTLKEVEAILDVFQAHGHSELDTARVYTGGTSEEMLGDIDWKKRGLVMETKLYPNVANARLQGAGVGLISHKPEDLRLYLDVSLKALKADKIDMWYLHGPDRTTPFEDTLKGVNDLYKEGKFERFGISNFMAWEVAEMIAICNANGYIKPTAYQGIYNAVHRQAFNLSLRLIIGGGFFTGRYRSLHDEPEPGSRFDPTKGQGRNYRNRYWNEAYFKALASIEAVTSKHNLTLAEVALRWISHHSLLKREYGDAVIIGASSLNHIEQNLVDLEKGPLPDDIVETLDEAWSSVKAHSTKYFH